MPQTPMGKSRAQALGRPRALQPTTDVRFRNRRRYSRDPAVQVPRATSFAITPPVPLASA
jgi:hypothetical protein